MNVAIYSFISPSNVIENVNRERYMQTDNCECQILFIYSLMTMQTSLDAIISGNYDGKIMTAI